MTGEISTLRQKPGSAAGADPAADVYGDYEEVPQCPICGSPERGVVDAAADVVRCRACGHRYVEPRPTQDAIARGYSRPAAYQSWLLEAEGRARMWRRRYEQTLAGIPPGRLLDVGAGIGTFLAVAQNHGWTVEGTEVSMTAAAHAHELHGLSLRLGMLESAVPSGQYDAITLWHVVEHLPDPLATLRHCRTLLREEGRIVLAMPNDGAAAWLLTSAANRLRLAMGRQPSARYERLRPGVESHIHHFDEQSIRRLLMMSDFHVESVTVDDASPSRRWRGSVIFAVRRWLSALTPWMFVREMLVVARPCSADDRGSSVQGPAARSRERR